MKRRILFLVSGSLLLMASSSQAGLYFSDFSTLGSGAPLVPVANGTGPGVDGWYQSEANTANASPLAYGQSITGYGMGVAVGSSYEFPSTSSFYVEQTIGLPFAAAPLAPIPSQISMTFTVGRDTGIDPLVQNTFEIGAYEGSTNLFSLVLASSLDADIWKLYYRTGNASNILLSNDFAVSLDQITNMTVGFTKSGPDAVFALTLATTLDTLNFGGTLTNLGDATLDSLRISMLEIPDKVTPEDTWGTNFVAFTNVAVIPEPSSWMLGGLAAGMFLIRRRRA